MSVSPREVVRTLDALQREGTFVRPGRTLGPGEIVDELRIDVERLRAVVVGSARRVAGVRGGARSTTVVWSEGADELAVDPGGVRLEMDTGLIHAFIPVQCDQTDAAEVIVTFAVGSPDRRAGLVASVGARPQGPAIVVDRWGSALVALAWSVVLDTANSLAGAAGRDHVGDRLIAGELVANKDVLSVTPMARHRFGG